MPPIKPPSAEEIEKALAASHSAVAPQAAPVPPNPIPIKPQVDSEIYKAVEEFQAVDFQNTPPQTNQSSENESGVINFIIKHSGGSIKDRRQAEYVVLFFVGFCILAAVFIFLSGAGPVSPPDREDIIWVASPEGN